LMNFSRGDKRTSTYGALTRQRASPAVDELTSQRRFIQSCNAIAEADHDALSKGFVIDGEIRGQTGEFPIFELQNRQFTRLTPNVPSDAQELLMQRPDLPRRQAVDTQLAQDIDAKFILHGKPPCAHENPKIRRVFGAKELPARLQDVLP